MSDKKNIDELFKDAFDGFEASPNPMLWDKISDKLDAKEAKKKREGIVFLPWLYKAAGIAAAIVLLFFAGNEFFNPNSDVIDGENQITSTSKENTTKNTNSGNSKETDTNTAQKEKNTSSKTSLEHQEGIADENTVNDHNVQKGSALQNAVITQNEKNATTNSQQSSNNQLYQNTTVQNDVTAHQNNAVATVNSSQKGNTNTFKNTTTIHNTTQNNQTTTHNNSTQNNTATNDRYASNTTPQNAAVKGTQSVKNTIENHENTENAVAQNASNTNANTSNGNSTITTTNTDTEAITETTVAEVKKDDKIKKSLLDVINELHDLEKDNTEVAETTPKKWTISPNASPVYYNTLSSGSPIDETFADNTKSGDVNFSYGVNVGYDVSKRLTVRSGIHKVDYSYSTKDIALVPSINGTELTTIAFRTNGAAFDIKDRQAAPTNVVFSQYQLPSTVESSIIQKQIEGNLNQRMSYIEVPVEVKYAVLDTKLGVNVIGGVSTLLLTENSIILDSPELYTELGEATNVNDVSFSTNIGLGIDYKVSDKIEVNLEPMLKYQLNTFSGNTGNFKPYSVGVYTGVSFRF